MTVVTALRANRAAPLVLTCEHAACTVPLEYDGLGIDADELQQHIGWDIGAAPLTRTLAERLDVPAVLAGVSRLVIDCNRDLGDHDLIVGQSDGVRIPGNQALSPDERERRVREFYEPYHHAVDAEVARHPGALVLSIHSFTPVLSGMERRFDIGVLFDSFHREAHQLGEALAHDGFRVRYNQPYSGLDGLIYSARRHGMRHARTYLELEVNNGLLRSDTAAQAVAQRIAPAVAALIGQTCD